MVNDELLMVNDCHEIFVHLKKYHSPFIITEISAALEISHSVCKNEMQQNKTQNLNFKVEDIFALIIDKSIASLLVPL